MPKLTTLKELVSQASMELGLAQRPVSSAISTQDQDIIQMRALLHAVADEVLLEQPYVRSLGDGSWIASQDGTRKPDFTDDTDVILFDARLATDGIKYRFLKAKGLEYGEELRDFSSRMNRLAGRGAPVLDLDTDAGREI